MISLNDLQARLRRFSSVRRGLLNATLGFRLGALAGGAGIAGLLLLSGRLPNAFLNLGLFLLLGGFCLVLAAAYLRRRARFRSALDEAFRMEDLAVGADSRIVSALDFLQQGIETPLTRRVIERAAEDVSTLHETRLDRSERRRRLQQFGVTVGLFLLLGLTPWFG